MEVAATAVRVDLLRTFRDFEVGGDPKFPISSSTPTSNWLPLLFSKALVCIFMSNGSPTAYLLWAILSCIVRIGHVKRSELLTPSFFAPTVPRFSLSTPMGL